MSGLIKELLRKPTVKDILRGHLKTMSAKGGRELARDLLWQDLEVLFGVLGSLPSVINAGVGAVSQLVKEINEKFTSRLFVDFAGSILSDVDLSELKECGKGINELAGNALGAQPATLPGIIGRLLTLVCAKVNAAHASGVPAEDPHRGEGVGAFLANLDFGEIMEMVEGSDPYVLKAIETFNQELWKYPAKVGTLVATLIPLINIVIKSVREIMAPIEKDIGPDLLADIILSLVRGVDGAETAKLLNTCQELLRRVHTGSLRLGKGGKPLMQLYLTDVLKACLPAMNPELLTKARVVLSEDKLSIAQALADALHDNPAIAAASLSAMGAVKSADFKARTSRLGVYEDIDQDSLKEALTRSLSELDTYEIAAFINTGCRILNRAHRLKPGFLMGLAGGVVDSLDPEEIKETAQWLAGDLVQALKPLAPTLMPVFIKALSELLSPDGGYESAEQADALQGLMATLAKAQGGEK